VERNGHVSASRFMRQRRQNIVGAVSQWTREPKYRVNELLSELSDRAEELELVADPHDSELPSQLVSYITSLVMNHRFTGRFKQAR